jgi:predicted nucleotide-binding protein
MRQRRPSYRCRSRLPPTSCSSLSGRIIRFAVSELIDHITQLIEVGERLAPQGGSIYYNGELQSDYLEWRYQVLEAIEAVGLKTKQILDELKKDSRGQYFYATSAGNILGGLKAAKAMATNMTHGTPTVVTTPSARKAPKSATKAFIVHGHEVALREQTARFISSLDIEPVILMDQVNRGQTLIEKLESNADAAFAVILCTGDDLGKGKDADDLGKRPRQNVILELGYFVGALGRERVCVLMEPCLEMPSDVHGVGYIEIDNAGAWKFRLAREMKAAGLNIDLNKTIQ